MSILEQDQNHHVETKTFQKTAIEWLQIQSLELKPSSIAKYTNIIRTYLLPEFGDCNICSINRNDVALFSRYLLTTKSIRNNGLAPKTVNDILSVLKSIFSYTTKEKNLPVADISGIYAKASSKPMRILSKEEQSRLEAYLCANLTTCNLGILLSLYTGLRIGEICALQWQDIDLQAQSIHIHRTMQRIQTFNTNEAKTKVMLLSPKSECSNRKIPLPNTILQLLCSYKEKDDAFLLTGKADYFMEPRTLANHFHIAAQHCDIQDVHFHVLRHTFATRCVELGFDIKSLSEILGHANVNITLNRYVHPSMEFKKQNMDMLSSLLSVNITDSQ